MLSRLAGRAVTGPFAFFIAGLIDVGLFVAVYSWARLWQRYGRVRQAGGRLSTIWRR